MKHKTPALMKWYQKLQLGRVFRLLGLPLWTFVGIGLAGWWFDNAATLIQMGIDQVFYKKEKFDATAYISPLILFVIPILAVFWISWWLKKRSHEYYNFTGLRKPEGKKVLIILVSNPNSAMYAIEYHFKVMKTLKEVHLIPSNNNSSEQFGDSSLKTATDIEQKCEKLSEELLKYLNVEIHETGVSPGEAQDTYDLVNRIFRQSDYEPNEIIADFTGGTKPMSVGMIMACLPAERQLEYVSYNSTKKLSHGPFIIDYQHSAFDLVG